MSWPRATHGLSDSKEDPVTVPSGRGRCGAGGDAGRGEMRGQTRGHSPSATAPSRPGSGAGRGLSGGGARPLCAARPSTRCPPPRPDRASLGSGRRRCRGGDRRVSPPPPGCGASPPPSLPARRRSTPPRTSAPGAGYSPPPFRAAREPAVRAAARSFPAVGDGAAGSARARLRRRGEPAAAAGGGGKGGGEMKRFHPGVALLLSLLWECTEAKKHCWYFEGLYPTYYICRSYEDCCGSRCCVRALSIQRLWYFWFLLMMGVLFCCGAGFFIRRRMYPPPLVEEPTFNVSYTRQPVNTASGSQQPGVPYYTDPGGPVMNPMAMAFHVQPNSPQGNPVYPPPPSYCNTPPPPYEQGDVQPPKTPQKCPHLRETTEKEDKESCHRAVTKRRCHCLLLLKDLQKQHS
uniref:WW domain binding protein VOPP1 n=1 Tax=Corvus moneduloides TaxID=1196302 RepID=A0A8C3DGJ8_CORMO